MSRWLKFNLVGLIGVGVQLSAFAALIWLARLDYIAATLVAVELTVLHNFVWHERWTWRDRSGFARPGVIDRLIQFNLTNGLVSIGGNLLVMMLLAGYVGLPHLAANGVAIVACSILNFLLSDRLVFA